LNLKARPYSQPLHGRTSGFTGPYAAVLSWSISDEHYARHASLAREYAQRSGTIFNKVSRTNAYPSRSAEPVV
jgi:hypothetical protein